MDPPVSGSSTVAPSNLSLEASVFLSESPAGCHKKQPTGSMEQAATDLATPRINVGITKPHCLALRSSWDLNTCTPFANEIWANCLQKYCHVCLRPKDVAAPWSFVRDLARNWSGFLSPLPSPRSCTSIAFDIAKATFTYTVDLQGAQFFKQGTCTTAFPSDALGDTHPAHRKHASEHEIPNSPLCNLWTSVDHVLGRVLLLFPSGTIPSSHPPMTRVWSWFLPKANQTKNYKRSFPPPAFLPSSNRSPNGDGFPHWSGRDLQSCYGARPLRLTPETLQSDWNFSAFSSLSSLRAPPSAHPKTRLRQHSKSMSSVFAPARKNAKEQLVRRGTWRPDIFEEHVLLDHCQHIKVDSPVNVDLNCLTATEVIDPFAASNFEATKSENFLQFFWEYFDIVQPGLLAFLIAQASEFAKLCVDAFGLCSVHQIGPRASWKTMQDEAAKLSSRRIHQSKALLWKLSFKQIEVNDVVSSDDIRVNFLHVCNKRNRGASFSYQLWQP